MFKPDVQTRYQSTGKRSPLSISHEHNTGTHEGGSADTVIKELKKKEKQIEDVNKERFETHENRSGRFGLFISVSLVILLCAKFKLLFLAPRGDKGLQF
jgi:hypothetical protein